MIKKLLRFKVKETKDDGLVITRDPIDDCVHIMNCIDSSRTLEHLERCEDMFTLYKQWHSHHFDHMMETEKVLLKNAMRVATK